MFDKLRSMFRKKDDPEEARIRADLNAFIECMSQDDWNVATLLAGYHWKFGQETSDLAFIRGIQTLQYLNGTDPALKAAAARSMNMTYQWFQRWPQAREWGEECVRLAVAGKKVKADPQEGPTTTSPEEAYVQNIRKYGLQKDDMQPLATISGFAWKHANMQPKRAVEYAMQTIYLSRHGSQQERKDAETTWQSAVVWSVEEGPDALVAGMTCVRMVQTGKA